MRARADRADEVKCGISWSGSRSWKLDSKFTGIAAVPGDEVLGLQRAGLAWRLCDGNDPSLLSRWRVLVRFFALMAALLAHGFLACVPAAGGWFLAGALEVLGPSQDGTRLAGSEAGLGDTAIKIPAQCKALGEDLDRGLIDGDAAGCI